MAKTEQESGIDTDRYIPKWKVFKRGRLRIYIHHQDANFETHTVKFKDDYTITIKKKMYFVLQEAIIYGEYPTLHYYYNNPWPIKFTWQKSNTTVDKITTKEVFQKMDVQMQKMLADTTVDARSMKILFDSRLINGFYAEGGMFSGMKWWHWLLIIGGTIIAILQATGTFDVFGWLGIVT